MKHIFDSSSIINLCADRRIDKLQESGTLSLTLYELGNAIWKQVYHRRSLSQEEGGRALTALVKVLKNMREVSVQDEVAVLNIAIEQGLTYYDASYIQATIEDNSTLITDDERLSSAAKRYVKTATSTDIER